MPFNVKFSDGTVINNIPDGTSKEDVASKASQYFQTKGLDLPSELQPVSRNDSSSSSQEDNSSVLGEAGKGVARGLLTTGAMLVEGTPALANSVASAVTGNEEYKQSAKEDIAKLGQSLENINKDYGASVRLADADSADDYLKATVGLVSEAVPSLLGSLGAGAVAKYGAETVAKTVIKDIAENQIKSIGTKAALVGAGLESYRQNATETYADIAQDGVDAPGTALLTGAGKAALDVITPLKILNRTGKAGESALMAAFKEGASDALWEGTTEAAQQGLDILADKAVLGKPMMTRDNAYSLLENFVGGAGSGGITGGIHAGVEQAFENRASKTFDEKSAPAAPSSLNSTPTNNTASSEEVSPEPVKVTPKPIEKDSIQPVDDLLDTNTADMPPEGFDLASAVQDTYKTSKGKAGITQRMNDFVGQIYDGFKFNPKMMKIDGNSTMGKILNVMKPIHEAGVKQTNDTVSIKAPNQSSIDTAWTLYSALNKNSTNPDVARVARREGLKAMLSPKSPIKVDKQAFTLNPTEKKSVITYLRNNLKQPIEYYSNKPSNELLGEAFATYHFNKGKPEYEISNKALPVRLQKSFDYAENQLGKIKNVANNSGITKLSDIFQNKKLDPESATAGIDEAMARAGLGMTQYRQEVLNKRVPIEKRTLTSNSKDPLMFAGGLFEDPVSMMDKDPLMAYTGKVAEDTNSDARNMLQDLQPFVSDVMERNGPTRFNKLVDILDSNRLNEFKGQLNKDGHFIWKDKEGNLMELRDKQASQDIATLQKQFEKILDYRKLALRTHPTMQNIFHRLGMSVFPTVSDIDAALSRPDAKEKLSEKQVENLKALRENLSLADEFRTKDYVPFIRRGDWAVKVEKKGEKGKKDLVSMVQYYGENVNKPKKDKYYDHAQQELDKYKDNPDYIISKPFRVTDDEYNRNIRQLGDPIELITSLLSRDKIGGNAKNKSDVESLILENLLEGMLSKTGLNHFRKSRDIGGYLNDWHSLLPEYFTNMSYFYSRTINNPRYQLVRDHLLKNYGRDSNYSKFVNDYIDYNLNYTKDNLANKFRAFNFVWALGANFISGALQVGAVPQTVLPEMTLLNNSVTKSTLALGKGFKDVSAFMAIPKYKQDLEAFDFNSEKGYESLRKKGWDEDSVRALKEVRDMGAFAENINMEVDANKKTTDKLLKVTGALMRNAEEWVRGTTALAALDQMRDPRNLLRYHQYVLENSAKYREYLQQHNQTAPDKAFLTKWMIDKSLGIFGKEGRSPYSRSWLGNLLAPFTTFTWQVGFNRFYRRLNERGGKKASVLAAAAIVGLSGLWGLPGAALLKFVTEQALQGIYGETFDLNKELYDILGDLPADDLQHMTAAGFLTRGGLDNLTGMDIGRRLAFQAPGEQLLEGGVQALSGNGSQQVPLNGVLAPVAAPFQMLGGIKRDYENGIGLGTAIATNAFPVAPSYIAKAMFEYPNYGKQYRGTTVQTPQEASSLDQFLMNAIGARSYQEGIIRRNVDLQQEFNDPYKNTKNMLKNQLTTAFLQWNQANADGDVDAEQEAYDKVESTQQKMLDFIQAKNLPDGGTWMKSASTDAFSEALSRVNKDYDNVQNFKKQSKTGRVNSVNMGLF